MNLCGAEFGRNVFPGEFGREYTYNSEASFRYFTSKGLNLFRVCLRWERLQPALRGPLDPANLTRLKQNVAWAKAAGGRAIIDIHNFGRYAMNEAGGLKEYVIDNVYGGVVKVSTADFIDLWVRLSDEFGDEDGVWAYDLMCEPHDMGAADWKQTSQAALSAIRANGDGRLVMISGDDWSSANRWVRAHGSFGWIGDPADNFMYQAHLYFDSDESGSYAKPASFSGTSYDYQLTLNPSLAAAGEDRARPFLEWCAANGAAGYLGEYGVPNDDPRWLNVLDRLLAALDAAGMPGTYWAAGEWWGSYSLSVQPLDDFTIDRPQLATLQRHPGAVFLACVSAASGAGAVAPGSLAAAYGIGLLPADFDPAAVQLLVGDRRGLSSAARVLYVSPLQVNFVVPAEFSEGVLDVTIVHEGRAAAIGTLRSERVAPALFSGAGDGRGTAAANVVRLKPDGSQERESAAAPIDFAGSRVFLELYGTGLRNASGVVVRIGPAAVTPAFFGAHPVFDGLDQVNLEIPDSLAGAGDVPVVLIADGKPSNEVRLAFR